jgi:hypothetical protein
MNINVGVHSQLELRDPNKTEYSLDQIVPRGSR